MFYCNSTVQSLQGIEDGTVGIVDGGSIQRGQVNQSRFLTVVPHRLAYDGKRDVLAFGNACPCVAGNVGGEGYGQAEHLSECLQVTVHVVEHCLVLPSPVALHAPYDGQEVWRACGAAGILTHYILHGPLPLDTEQLPRLPPAVGKYTVLQVAFPEIRHIDERHASGVEREHEQVAGEVEGSLCREVEVSEAADNLEWDGTFDGLVHPRVDMLERIALPRQRLLHGAVVDGTQSAHIKGRGVGAHARRLQIAFIRHHERGVDRAESYVAPRGKETREAVSHRLITFGSLLPTHKSEVIDNTIGKTDKPFGL